MRKPVLFLTVLFFMPMLVFSQWELVHTFPAVPLNMEVVGSTIYVVTGSGLLASEDNGQSWINKNNNISDTLIRAFYADSTILMAAVGGNGGGINISHDGGNTWTVSSAGISNPYGIFSLSKAGDNLLCGTFGTFAGDSSILYLSIDGGTNWTAQVTITLNSGFPCIEVKDSLVVASSYTYTHYYSTDYGVTYTAIATPFGAEDMAITNSTIVAAASNGNSNIRYSADNGMSWQVGEDVITAEDLKNSNDTVYAATLKGFHYSFDAGMTWMEYNVGLPANTNCYVVAAKGNDLWLGTQPGDLYKLSRSAITSVNQPENELTGNIIFPNPANGFLDLRWASDYSRIELYNSWGEKILTNNTGGNKIYIGNVPQGIYVMKVYEDTKIYTKEIIIQ